MLLISKHESKLNLLLLNEDLLTANRQQECTCALLKIYPFKLSKLLARSVSVNIHYFPKWQETVSDVNLIFEPVVSCDVQIRRK